MNCDVTFGLPFVHVRSAVAIESLVIFEFPSTSNWEAYLNKRISVENSNTGGFFLQLSQTGDERNGCAK